MNRFLVIYFLVIASVSFSQTSEKYNSDYENFYRAEELYEKMQFGAARKEFRNFLDKYDHPTDPMYIKARYYEGVSALELFNNDAVDLLERFNIDYPESIYRKDIYFRLGKYYYQKKDYDEALVWFDQLTADDVEPEYQDEFYFKVGYSNFKQGNLDAAKGAFYEIKDGISQYANPALYYYSHIAYQQGDYQVALEGFLKLENDEKFGKVVPYYILQIYYLQGKYDMVTEYAPKLEGTDLINEKDLNHLIGDAYYRTGKYDEAVPYLEAYDKAAKTTRDEDYQLGYAYYKSKMYDKAIKLFDRVTKEPDSMSQVAYYQIGDCYMQLKNYAPARLAFKQASEIDSDPKIQEDALYQFAVLSYKLDLNPYNEAIVAFETYLEKYPNSTRKNDVYQYLVNVYTSTNNYGKALESLDKLPNKDIKLKKAYQLIAYNYGIELYQQGRFQDAISTLDLVNKYPIDPILTGKAKFWAADASFMLANYTQAIASYRSFINMPATMLSEMKNDAYYNIGYSYLNIGDTTLAMESFRTYIQNNPINRKKLADANMRVADAFFMRKQNQESVTYYEKVLSMNVAYQDQALFYSGMLYGVMSKPNNKISNLLNIVNNYSTSRYVQPSLYEIGRTYKLREEYTNALRYFNQLITDYPNASQVKDAHIDIADIYYKRKEYAKAEQEYKLVLTTYGDDSYYCKAVGVGLQNVYSATGQHQKLEQLAQQYPCLEISNYALENVLFEPAYKDYESKLYSSAITKFKTYLDKYPQGLYSMEVLIYMGNSYYELGDLTNSTMYYERYLQAPNNTHTEFAASRVSKYYYNNKMYKDAIPFYERLESVSGDPEIRFNAKLGLMRCNYITEDYEAAAAYGDQVLKSNQLNAEVRLEAEYAYGMSSYYLNRFVQAITALEYVASKSKTVTASEAKFSIADIHYKQGDYVKATETINQLMKITPKYDYWIAKGLILQARVNIKQDNLFEAEQNLNLVRNNYPVQDDGVLDEANQLYDELMQMKSQPKSNILPEENKIIDLNNGGN